MVDATSTTDIEPLVTDTGAVANGVNGAKGHFAKAVEEAKAGAQALAGEARDMFAQKKSDLSGEAKAKSGEAMEKASTLASDAKVKAGELAVEGKARTSKAIVGLSKMLDDNVELIDEKVGPKYGDYARNASKSMQDAAAKLDAKSFDELQGDAREFVRKSPGIAVGMAVAAGYVLGRLFKK